LRQTRTNQPSPYGGNGRWRRCLPNSDKEEKQVSTRRKALARELEGAHMAHRTAIAKSKARLSAYEKLARRTASGTRNCKNSEAWTANNG